MFNKKLAIVGASGAVGRVFIELLDEMYPGTKDLFLVASKRSAGRSMFCGKQAVSYTHLTLPTTPRV